MAPRAPYQVTFAVITAAVGAFTLLQGLVVPVLAEIQAEFKTSQTTASWVLTSYLLSASVCTPLAGRVGDILGKQRVMTAMLLVLAAGCLGAAFAPNIQTLLVCRVLQGTGGGLLALSFGIIRDDFPRARMGASVSIISSLASAGYGLGIVVAGPIIEVLGFRWLFLIPMVLALAAAAVLTIFGNDDPFRTPSRLSVVPAVLLSSWLVALLLAISEGRQWGWTSPAVLGLLAAASILCPAWAYSEHRAAAPVIDLDLLKIRGVWTTNLVVLCTGFGIFAYYAFMPQFVATDPANGYGFGASVTEAGRYLLPSAFFAFVGGVLVSRIMRIVGARRLIIIGSVMIATAFGLVAAFHDHPWQILACSALQGFGSGLTFSCLAAIVLASVPASQTGVASGMNANIRTIGGAVGTALLAAIVTAHAGPDLVPSERGYTTAFAVLSAVLFLAALMALLVPRLRPRTVERVVEKRVATTEVAVVPAGGTVSV